MAFWLKYIFLQFTWNNSKSCSHQFWGFPFHLLHPLLKSLFLLYFLTDSIPVLPFSPTRIPHWKWQFSVPPGLLWSTILHPEFLQTGKLSLCFRDTLFCFFRSRCLLRHRHLSTTNKQQCDFQKLLFLKKLYKPFPTKAKMSPSGNLGRSQKSGFRRDSIRVSCDGLFHLTRKKEEKSMKLFYNEGK